jgi:hypothetical protein
MYVEISPRQSGKTTRLIEAAISYLRSDDYARIGIVSNTQTKGKYIKDKLKEAIYNMVRPTWIGNYQNLELLTHEFYLRRVEVISDVNSVRGLTVNYYFFDDFSVMEPRKMLFNNTIVENGYYCTTPSEKRSTINMITNHCFNNNIEIKFFNPWTEARISEQEGFADYIRENVLNSWSNYMESIGMNVAELKENWFTTRIKRHKFF